MLYVALALAAVLAATVGTFARLLAAQQRQHARREDLLLNQLLHAAGKPWQPAPADNQPAQTAPPLEPLAYTATPEQLPVY